MTKKALKLQPDKLNCSNFKNHTHCPDGYMQYFEWAAKKSKTHNQTKCSVCGFFVIWTHK